MATKSLRMKVVPRDYRMDDSIMTKLDENLFTASLRLGRADYKV